MTNIFLFGIRVYRGRGVRTHTKRRLMIAPGLASREGPVDDGSIDTPLARAHILIDIGGRSGVSRRRDVNGHGKKKVQAVSSRFMSVGASAAPEVSCRKKEQKSRSRKKTKSKLKEIGK
jgi:hypothetical protein